MLEVKDKKIEIESKEVSMMREQLELEVFFRCLGKRYLKNVDLMGGAEVVGNVKVLGRS